MNKKAMLPAFFLAVFLLSTFVGTLQVNPAQAATNFSGIISADTTWTKTNSPYDLAGPARVANGVTLTIESGTTVNFHGYNLEVNGTLVAVGTRTDPISFTLGGSSGGGIIFSESSTAWNEQAGSGCIIMNAVFSGTMLSISSSPKIYNNSIKGAQGVPSTMVINGGSPEIVSNVITFGFESSNTILILGGSPVISNNKITGYTDNGLAGLVGMDTTHMARFGGSIAVDIYGGNVYLTNNEISYGEYGISVGSGSGSVIIERNLFGTIAYGAINVSPAVAVSIQNNTFTKDSGGISGVTPLTTITYNNIENTYGYDLQVGQNGTINATNNWWGTTEASAISNKIRDGTVNFAPFLTAANPQALPNFTGSPLVLPVPPKHTGTTISLSSASILERTSVTISGTVDYANSPLADVPVALTAIDPNGNLQNIGTTATDASGIYSASWTPPIDGAYAVTASFAGNQTYSGSNATINLTVGPATPSPLPSSSTSPSQNPTSTPEQTSPQTVSRAEFYGVIAALAAAVVALLIVIVVFLLRKKP